MEKGVVLGQSLSSIDTNNIKFPNNGRGIMAKDKINLIYDGTKKFLGQLQNKIILLGLIKHILFHLYGMK